MHYSSAVIFSFIPQVQKKVFIENTVPLIISLKRLLEQKRSPVLKDLMTYLQVRHVHLHRMMELSEMMEFDYYADPRRRVSVTVSLNVDLTIFPSGHDAGQQKRSEGVLRRR